MFIGMVDVLNGVYGLLSGIIHSNNGGRSVVDIGGHRDILLLFLACFSSSFSGSPFSSTHNSAIFSISIRYRKTDLGADMCAFSPIHN